MADKSRSVNVGRLTYKTKKQQKSIVLHVINTNGNSLAVEKMKCGFEYISTVSPFIVNSCQVI